MSKKLKILVVEDDFTTRMILQTMLTDFGTVDIAVDGTEAIKAFNLSRNENSMYDVVFLDIMMPNMNGHDVLDTIRSYEEKDQIIGSKKVKIIMCSALDDSKNVIRAFRNQCEGYITKPIQKKKVLKQLQALGLVD